MSKELFTVPWDARSDQPDRINDRALRRRLRRGAWGDYLKTALTAAGVLPISALHYLGLAASGRFAAAERPWRDILGIAVSPTPERARLHDTLAELGAQHFEVRMPCWERDQFDDIAAFIAELPGKVLVVVCQDRTSVCDHAQWQADLEAIYGVLPDNVEAVQIGNATNRLKWGCTSIGEYLELLSIADDIHRTHAAGRLLLGSSVIDFEPLATIRSLFNGQRFQLDATAALLYVDRRGPPGNRQYLWFNTARKIRYTAALVAASRRSRNRLWLTEVNWPLAGHGRYAPTASELCVDEDSAAAYLREYCEIARRVALVERVYVWQLVARGYGLIDPADDGSWRRRPAFAMLQQLLNTSE